MKSETRWQKWLPLDVTSQILDAFSGMPLEEMQLNFEIRMAAAGFGKRYRRGSWQVAITQAYVQLLMKHNPQIPPALLAARTLRARPNGWQVVTDYMRHEMEKIIK